MIVFLFLFIFIIIVFILMMLLSSLNIIVKNITIENIDEAYKILQLLIKEKNEKLKLNFLDYVKFEVKVQIKFLNKIIIFSINIDNKKMKKMLIKQYDREIKKNKDIEKDKKKVKELSKKIIPTFILKNTDLNIKLGTDNAAFTAIITSIISSLIAITLLRIADVKKMKNYDYKIIPIYLDKDVFFLQFSCIITSKIVHIMKVICKKEEIKNE